MQLTSCIADSERATHSGARTPNLLNFLAPTGAATHPATLLCCGVWGRGSFSFGAEVAALSGRNVMKQSFIKIHYLFNTQVATPPLLPLSKPLHTHTHREKANKINLRLRRTERTKVNDNVGHICRATIMLARGGAGRSRRGKGGYTTAT